MASRCVRLWVTLEVPGLAEDAPLPGEVLAAIRRTTAGAISGVPFSISRVDADEGRPKSAVSLGQVLKAVVAEGEATRTAIRASTRQLLAGGREGEP